VLLALFSMHHYVAHPSFQAMLFAIGLGAGALPMAAAINWIVKDGLGQVC
jgi:hypothetical protein